MIDPVSAMATATAAFNALKKGVEVGQDLENMAGSISKWMSCLSDVEQAEKEAKNPPIFKKIISGKSVEAQALELFMTKKKIKEQREQLQQLISWQMGPAAWQDLIGIEVQIRKDRQRTLYAQREKRQKFVEWVSIIVLLIVGSGAIWWFTWFLMNLKG